MIKKELFHNKHEEFTEKAFSEEGLLPDRYVFILTNLCNLNCSFCFQDKKPRKDAMKTNDWLKLIDQLPDYARVTFTGGEPLLFRGFDEVFSKVASQFDCNIISNGLLLSEKKIDYLLSFSRFKVLSLSIDDIGNKIRNVNSNLWKRELNLLKYFLKKRKEVNSSCVLDVKTVVLDSNAKDLFKIYKFFVEEIGVDTHAFQFLKGSPIQHADIMFDFDDILKKSHAETYKMFDVIIEQFELVRKYNLKNGTTSFVHPKVCSLTSEKSIPNLDYINMIAYNKNNFLPCKFPWSSVHINVEGTLFPCLAISMGNVKEEKLINIINGKNFTKFKNIIREKKTVEACNRCGWLRPIVNNYSQSKGDY